MIWNLGDSHILALCASPATRRANHPEPTRSEHVEDPSEDTLRAGERTNYPRPRIGLTLPAPPVTGPTQLHLPAREPPFLHCSSILRARCTPSFSRISPMIYVCREPQLLLPQTPLLIPHTPNPPFPPPIYLTPPLASDLNQRK